MKHDTATKQVAIYSRVSTDMQATEGHSLGTQEELCRAYCDREFGPAGYEAKVYLESGQSGAKTIRQFADDGEKVRSALSDLCDDVEHGNITHVVTYEVSRMAREDFLWKLIRHTILEPNNVSLRIVSGNLNLDNEDDAFMADMLSLVSSRERALIRRRILDAQESRRKAGYWPQGHPPWGWRWQTEDEVAEGERKTIVPDMERIMWVNFMVDRILRLGWSCRRVAEAMQKTGVKSGRTRCRWTTVAVHRVVKHFGHAGLVKQKDGSYIKGAHYRHRIFDPETHHRILDVLSDRNVENERHYASENFPLSGIIRCGHCGRRLQVHRASTADERFYRCSVSEPGEERVCPGLTKKAEAIEQHVYHAVADFASSPEMSRLVGEEAEKILATRKEDLTGEIEEIQDRLEELDNKLHEWAEAFTDGKMSEKQFTTVSSTWQEEYDELEEERAKLERRMHHQQVDRNAMQHVKSALETFEETLPELPADRQREILSDLLETLTLNRAEDGVELTIKIKFLPEITRLIPVHGRRPADGLRSLTDRELAILKLKGDGLTNAEIDARLNARTAGTTLHRARERTGIQDTDELVEAARPLIEEALPRLPLEGRMREPQDGPLLTELQDRYISLRAKGLKYREIAEECGKSTGNISATLTVARKKLGAETVDEAIEIWREKRGGED